MNKPRCRIEYHFYTIGYPLLRANGFLLARNMSKIHSFEQILSPNVLQERLITVGSAPTGPTHNSWRN